MIPNARLCKALIDRITDRANIIETGTESYRFRRTLEKRKGRSPIANTTAAPPPLPCPAAEKPNLKVNMDHCRMEKLDT